MPDFLTYLDPFLFFLADDPALRVFQLTVLGIGSIGVFLVFYVTRDIILRTESIVYMISCIVIAALLPGIGFLLYILIRPPRTIKEREVEQMLLKLTKKL